MLTPSIRAYLKAAREARYLFTRVVLELKKNFDLTPEEIGRVLVQDLRENI